MCAAPVSFGNHGRRTCEIGKGQPRCRCPAETKRLPCLYEWVESESLRRHNLAVEAAMRAYARYYGEDEELWGITGLLHDLDYERHPDMDDAVNGHPRTELRFFRENGYPQELIHAVEAHATFLGVPRESLLDKALLACDEMTGLILACAYVRPDRDLRSVKAQFGEEEVAQPQVHGSHRPGRELALYRGVGCGFRRASGAGAGGYAGERRGAGRRRKCGWDGLSRLPHGVSRTASLARPSACAGAVLPAATERSSRCRSGRRRLRR